MSLVCCLCPELPRLFVILFYTASIRIHGTKVALCKTVSLSGREGVIMDSFFRILRYTRSRYRIVYRVHVEHLVDRALPPPKSRQKLSCSLPKDNWSLLGNSLCWLLVRLIVFGQKRAHPIDNNRNPLHCSTFHWRTDCLLAGRISRKEKTCSFDNTIP